MEIVHAPFRATDWSQGEAEEHRGDAGTSFWRAVELGNVRARLVEYSPGFRSDHWCTRGHVMLVLDGAVTITLKDGSTHHLTREMGFVAGDDLANPHLAASEGGARVFIVD
jgi:hypothetical protein